MTRLLVIVNGPAYGTDQTVNALRLSKALARRDDTRVRLFLMGDAVRCAVAGQPTPNGYDRPDRMLRAIVRHGGRIACCGASLDARGLTTSHLIDEAPRSTMEDLGALRSPQPAARWPARALSALSVDSTVRCTAFAPPP